MSDASVIDKQQPDRTPAAPTPADAAAAAARQAIVALHGNKALQAVATAFASAVDAWHNHASHVQEATITAERTALLRYATYAVLFCLSPLLLVPLGGYVWWWLQSDVPQAFPLTGFLFVMLLGGAILSVVLGSIFYAARTNIKIKAYASVMTASLVHDMSQAATGEESIDEQHDAVVTAASTALRTAYEAALQAAVPQGRFASRGGCAGLRIPLSGTQSVRHQLHSPCGSTLLIEVSASQQPAGYQATEPLAHLLFPQPQDEHLYTLVLAADNADGSTRASRPISSLATHSIRDHSIWYLGAHHLLLCVPSEENGHMHAHHILLEICADGQVLPRQLYSTPYEATIIPLGHGWVSVGSLFFSPHGVWENTQGELNALYHLQQDPYGDALGDKKHSIPAHAWMRKFFAAFPAADGSSIQLQAWEPQADGHYHLLLRQVAHPTWAQSLTDADAQQPNGLPANTPVGASFAYTQHGSAMRTQILQYLHVCATQHPPYTPEQIALGA